LAFELTKRSLNAKMSPASLSPNIDGLSFTGWRNWPWGNQLHGRLDDYLVALMILEGRRRKALVLPVVGNK